MTGKILVTYASRTGSTVGVAEAISKILAEGGAKVDLKPMHVVNDLAPYSAVIAGSAIQANQWLPEAMQFLKKHQTDLVNKSVAIFSVCMTLAMPNGEKYRSGVAQWLEPVRRLVIPINEGYFAGILNINKVPDLSDRIKFRISVILGVWKTGDHRNWNAIKDWAINLKNMLEL
jgi:menaquinone-dependent protoporphyrinogen oxidase